MRLLALLCITLLTLFARDTYELQLLASKLDNHKKIEEFIQKGAYAGLKCYDVQEKRKDGTYKFVRCDKTANLQKIEQSIQKAKTAGLDYYILKPDNNAFNKIAKKPLKQKAPLSSLTVVVDNLSNVLFGKNEELVRILYNQNDISKSYLENRKAKYLKDVASRHQFNGLFLKGSSAKNFDKQKMDYNMRLEWNIFDGGYMDAKKETQNKKLEKELEYERILDEIHRANLELSLYKMSAISNYINYRFLKQQETLLYKTFQRDKRKFNASLITASQFYQSKKTYEQISHKASYYGALEHQLYDYKLKPFISAIENTDIADKKDLIQYAFAHSFALKSNKNKIKRSDNIKEWTDRFKTNIYIENKKYFFLEEADTIAGVGVQIPLDFHRSEEKPQDIEIEANRLKNKMIKKLIARNIEEIYHKVDYYKANIKTLKSDIVFFQKEIKTLQIKLQYPLSNQAKDPNDDLDKMKLTINQHHQKIWQQRTEILKLFLKMQNISGVQILI